MELEGRLSGHESLKKLRLEILVNVITSAISSCTYSCILHFDSNSLWSQKSSKHCYSVALFGLICLWRGFVVAASLTMSVLYALSGALVVLCVLLSRTRGITLAVVYCALSAMSYNYFTSFLLAGWWNSPISQRQLTSSCLLRSPKIFINSAKRSMHIVLMNCTVC